MAAADPQLQQRQFDWPTPSERGGICVEENEFVQEGEGEGATTAEQELAAIERLKKVLPSWVVDVPLMVKRHPRLVRADPKVLASRLQKLRELLHMCDDAELGKIVRAQPSLLNHSPEALASTVRQLSSLVPEDIDVAYLLSSRPILLKQSAKTLAANWESLKRHAALVPRWQQELDLFSRRRSTALGNLLLYGRKKHARLERVAALAPALRDRYALSTIFNMKDDAFEDKFHKTSSTFLLKSGPTPTPATPSFSSSSSGMQPRLPDAAPPPQHHTKRRQRIVSDDKEDASAAAEVPVVVVAAAKRQRGSRHPFCPKCDNPKCHKSHTYVAPCVREGQVKPVRAKPKFTPGSSSPPKNQMILLSTILPPPLPDNNNNTNLVGNQLDSSNDDSWTQEDTAML